MTEDRWVFARMVEARDAGFPGARLGVLTPGPDVFAEVSARAFPSARQATAFERQLERRMGLGRYAVGSYRIGAPVSNPTLTAHGLARAARWHVVTSDGRKAVADLYAALGREAAVHVAQAIANATGRRLMLLDNERTPGTLARHRSVSTAKGRPWFSSAAGNPARPDAHERFAVGQVVEVQRTGLPVSTGTVEKVSRDAVFVRLGWDLVKFAPDELRVVNPSRSASKWTFDHFAGIYTKKDHKAMRRDTWAGTYWVFKVSGAPGWAAMRSTYSPQTRMRENTDLGTAETISKAKALAEQDYAKADFPAYLERTRHYLERNPSLLVHGVLDAVPIADPGALSAPARGPVAVPPPRLLPVARRRRRARAPAARSVRQRELAPGTSVSVPYTGRASYFGRRVRRTRDRGTVLSTTTSESGAPAVLVLVRRGRTGEEHTFPLSSVRRLPSAVHKSVKVKHGARIARLVKRYKDAPESLGERIERTERAREQLYDALRGVSMDSQDPAWTKPRARFSRLGTELELLQLAAKEIAGPDPWVNPRQAKGGGLRTATDYARALIEKGERYHAGAIDHDEFTRQGIHLWNAIQGRGKKFTAAVLKTLRDTEKKRNPRHKARGSRLARAAKMFRQWHEFGHDKLTTVRLPATKLPRYGVKLGEVVTIDYTSDKWGGKPVTYTHDTKRPRPWLVTDPDGRQLYLLGGKTRPTADGLVD